jgi:hypothetical protein
MLNDEMLYSTVTHCMVVSRKPSALYPTSRVSILLTKKIYFYILWICKMYIVLWIRTNHMKKYMFWIIWIVWLYSIISIMFKKWCMSEECWNWFKMFECVLQLRFKLCKIVWEHAMLKLFMFYEETMIWMISKFLMKC